MHTSLRPPSRLALWILLISVLPTANHAATFLTDQFELLDPDLAIAVVQDLPDSGFCNAPTNSFFCAGLGTSSPGPGRVGGGIDAIGRLYYFAVENGDTFLVKRLTAPPSGSEEVLVRIPRNVALVCPVNDDEPGTQETILYNMRVDPVNGILYLAVGSTRHITNCPDPLVTENGIIAISGLPVLLDVFLSYVPETASLAWNVPVHPQGLHAAEGFNLYGGPVVTSTDLSQSFAIRCGLPDDDPVAGERITEADPLPEPASGEGWYYVVETSYQGQRRAGRFASDGILRGRDASVLRGCP